jgi:ABC-type phosphate transport system substrate-binding protein
MKINSLLKIGIASALTLSATFFTSAEVVVVVHPGNAAALDGTTIKRIYLGKSSAYSTGNEAIVINQVPDSTSRQAFDSEVLGRSTSQISAYWSKQVFTGKGIPPKEVQDDSAVISLISNNKDAIGYVDKTAVTGAVKVVPVN